MKIKRQQKRIEGKQTAVKTDADDEQIVQMVTQSAHKRQDKSIKWLESAKLHTQIQI